MGTDTIAALPIPQLAGGQVYTWSFPICPHSVRINLAVVGALQYHVSTTTDPQQGLLIGRRQNGVTHIEAYRALPALNERTVASTIQQIRRPVVGCYRIREGCAFIFEEAEIDLCKSAFPELGSVFLLVERRAAGPAEGTFAFWRPDAFVCNLPSPFAIDPEILAKTPQPPDPVEKIGLAATLLRFLRRNAATLGFLAAALVLVLILPFLWMSTQSSIERNANVPIPVPETVPVATTLHGDVQVEWEPRALAGATGGLLRIIDGKVQRHVTLTAAALRMGAYVYAGGAGPVSFEMKAMDPDGRVFDVPTSAHAAATPPAPASELAVASAAPPPAPVAAPATPLKESRTPAAPVAVERKTPAKSFTPVATDRRTPPRTQALDDAPPVQPMQSLSPALTASLPAAAPPPAPPPPERHAPAPPVRAAKGAGRLIWTGTLERRGVLEFDQRTVSIGSLLGALPGVPVNVTVSPAEFGLGGLMVYTTDPKLDKHVEPPSAGNGWNRLTYIWDPERVRQIAVLESPNASNRFSHIALRSDARRCSMLVIDWATQ